MISASTILNIALEIERKGISFYEEMKKKIKNPVIDTIIAQEHEHIAFFQRLFNAKEGKWKDKEFTLQATDNEMLAKAYAETSLFGDKDPSSFSEDDLLNVAIMMEKDSVLFYYQLADMVGAESGNEEELAFIAELRKQETEHLQKMISLKKRQ